MVRIGASLRTQNAVMRRSDQPQVLLAASLDGSRDFGGVGDSDLGFTTTYHGNDHVIAGRGLNEHVHAGLFLEHL